MKMPTVEEVERTIDECNNAPVVNEYLRQFADLLRLLESAFATARMEERAVCIEICQEESTDNGTAQTIEARIRSNRNAGEERAGMKLKGGYPSVEDALSIGLHWAGHPVLAKASEARLEEARQYIKEAFSRFNRGLPPLLFPEEGNE